MGHAGLWQGRVWLNVEGQIVGNPEREAQEQIGIAIDALARAGRNTGKRRHPAMRGITEELALDLVMWAVYGDSNEEFERMITNRESLQVFEILPSTTGPAFDNWEAIIVESDEGECFVWRREGEQAPQSRVFPIGTFWHATEEAKAWVDGQSIA